MHVVRCYRRWLPPAIGVSCWLAMIVVASAQLDFRAGSLLEAPAGGELPLPSILPQPAEPPPPTPGSPVAADGPFAASANSGFTLPPMNPDFLYRFGAKARGY